MIIHDTNMRIPIFNTLYSSEKSIKSKNLDIIKLNNLDFQNVDLKRYPIINIKDKLTDHSSLFETILVSINDKLVDLFLNNKIKFTDISKKMNSMLDLKEFKKFKMIKVKKIEDIIILNKKVADKIDFILKR